MGNECPSNEWLPQQVSPWKAISLLYDVFLRHVRYGIGRGVSVRFWKDVWCGSSQLEEVHPAVFRVASSKESSVAKHIKRTWSSIDWLLCPRKNLNDWEVGDVASLLQSLEMAQVGDPEEDDCWFWSLDPRGVFLVDFLFQSLLRS